MKTAGSQLLGWCSPAKEHWLTDWIETHQPAVITEIGVYAGASLLPMAVAASSYESKVYGIDPWDAAVCLEGMKDLNNIKWWTKDEPPLHTVKDLCLNNIQKLGLTNVVLLQGKSDIFKDLFLDNEIGLLSIDGNHGPQALIDGRNYFPKVKPGGLIACDDEDWCEDGVLNVRAMINWLITSGCRQLDIIDDCVMLQKEKD